VSNPPVADGSLGLRVRPSAEEVSALVSSIGEIPDDERQVHFEVPLDPNDAEISAMLDMLAEDSSDAAPAGTLAVAPLPEAGTTLDVQRPVNVRLRHPYRANQLDPSLHDGSLTAIYGWLLKRPSATYGWSLKTFSDP
jgi:hypothetical protein